jgi:hypothetical protein
MVGSVSEMHAGQGREVEPVSWEQRRLDIANKLGEAAVRMQSIMLRRLAEMEMFQVDGRTDLSDAKNLRDLATALGICIEKAQLLTGGKTGQVGVNLEYRIHGVDMDRL